MPLLELQPSVDGRIRVFVRAQVPMLAGALFIGAEALVATPQTYADPDLVAGLVVVTVASLAAAFFPWERYRASWLALIALADVVSSALIRDALIDDIQSVGFLCVFPLAWLSYGFSRRFVGLAFLGALFITGFPFLTTGTLPTSASGWANVTTLPVLVLGLALGISVAAHRLQSSRREALRTAAQLEEALRTAQDTERLALAILETVDAAVAYFDADGKLDLANQNARTSVALAGFSLTQSPFAGADVFHVDRKTRVPLEEQVIPRALRGDLQPSDLQWIGPDGGQLAILASARQVRRDNGDLTGTVIVAHDVTELANAIEVREQFLRTVSHELRTPLTSIVGYIEIIAESIEPGEPEIASALETVQRNADDLLERISQLLLVNESYTEISCTEQADVALLVQHAVTDATPAGADAGHVHVTRIDPVEACIDATRFSHVVENLLSNATKYTPTGGTITTTLTTDPAGLTLSVSDTGIGMTPAEQRQVFDRFYRAPAARDGAIQGIGIGLALTKDIVAAHGGSITIDSTPGHGSTFTVRIPHHSAIGSTAAAGG